MVAPQSLGGLARARMRFIRTPTTHSSARLCMMVTTMTIGARYRQLDAHRHDLRRAMFEYVFLPNITAAAVAVAAAAAVLLLLLLMLMQPLLTLLLLLLLLLSLEAARSAVTATSNTQACTLARTDVRTHSLTDARTHARTLFTLAPHACQV
jgi:hypothetical protein